MRIILRATIAAGLLLATASCSSDEASGPTTESVATVAPPTTDASTTTVADTTPPSSVAETVAPPDTTGDVTGVSVSLDGLTDLQAQVFTQTISEAAQVGIDLDQECFKAGVSKLSDGDAQAILDAGPAGDPQLSAEGQAIGDELRQCAVSR